MNNIKDLFKLDKKILHIMNIGIKFSFLICTMAIIGLMIYNKFYISRNLFEGSLILFRTGLLYASQFLICGIGINQIIK